MTEPELSQNARELAALISEGISERNVVEIAVFMADPRAITADDLTAVISYKPRVRLAEAFLAAIAAARERKSRSNVSRVIE